PFPVGTESSGVRDLAVDGSGRKWVATDQGVFMLAADNSTWTQYTAVNSSLETDNVNAVNIAPDGTIWFGLNGSGAQQLSTDLSTWTTFNVANNELTSDNVYDVEFNSAGHVWFGTGSGLSVFDQGVNSWTNHPHPNFAGAPLAQLDVDPDDNVWTIDGLDVFMLNTNTATWTTYMAPNFQLFNTIVVDNIGRKWIGALQGELEPGGLQVLSADNATWDNKGELGLGSSTINDIVVSSANGDVWIAADDGSVVRSFLSGGGMYDGAIIGGYWGSLHITGDADLSYVTIEMGGKDQQSALQFINTPNTISAANLTVRASGGNGIEVENSDITLNDVTILSNRGNGLHLGTSGTVTLTNGVIQQNKQNGLYLEQDGELIGTDVTIASNLVAIYAADASAAIELTTVTVINNDGMSRLPVQTMIDGLIWQDNQQNDVEWWGGTIDADITWMNAPEIGRHIILGHVLVDATATLTIPMGTTFTFGSFAELTVNGDLVANGTFDNPIYLGAFSNHWDGVTLAGNTAVFQYTTIQDAITGLTINGTDTTMAYMTIAGNDTGISANNNATVTIVNSNIAGNSVTAVTNSSGAAFPVDARNNYWGHPNGPTHASNPNGGGDVVGDDVDFLSWRGPVLMDNLTTYAANETATDYSNLQYDAGVYTRLYADGRSVQFDTEGRHDFTLFPDARKQAYTYNPDGSTATFEVTAPGQTAPNAIWTFNYTNGKLDNITDPVGRVMAFEVDGNNQLTQVSIPEMGDHRFYYNEQNLMTQQMDAAGAVTEYGYNEYGRIASHTDPLREVTDANTGALSMSSELRQFVGSDTGYTLINDLAASDPDNPAPAAPTTGALNNSVAYGIGSRTTKTNEWGHILEQTDSLNRTTQMQRDEANNVTRMDFPNGDCVEANYDEQGNILSVNRLPATQCTLLPQDRDPLQQQTSARSYEAQFNQPKTLVDPGGDSITYIYDYELGLGDAGLLMRIEYPSVPDENGVLTTPTVNYTYNDLGLLATETDVRGTVTRYIYTQGTADEAAGGANPLFAPGVTPVPGLVTQVIADDGGFNQTTISKDFDELGNPQTIIFPGNVQTLATHDELGRLDSATSIEGIVTIYEYNDRGQLVRQVVDYTADGVTGDNVVTTYEYDSNGRLLHQRTAADGLVVETYSKYDLNGRLVSETDSQGNETRYVYDDADQLIQTIDPTQQSTFYTYTNQGMPETVTDAEGHVTRTVYDEYGRPKQIIRAEGELNLTTTYTYTIDSLVTAMEDTDGTVTCYEYDSLRRITKNIQDCGSGHLNLTISYAYDLAGNTVYITNTRGIVTYNEYDALGRLTLTRQDDGGLNYEARTTYNVAGNVDTNIAVDGTVTQYHYDTYNRLQQICEDSPGMNLCTSYGYDLHGRQDSVTDAEGIIQQTNFNRLGLPIQEIADVNGLAATISFEYDDLLNLVQIADPNGNLTRYTYTARQEVETELYADGTTKSFTYTPRGSVDTETLQDGAVIDHSYDAANRQTRLDFSTGGFQQFIYDDAGRLTNVSQTMDGHTTVTGYGYNRIGEVVTTTQQLDGGTAWLTQYAYDYALGEHTITYPSGTERVYKTDHINRLDAVEMGDSTIVADYAYDVFNRFNTVSYPTNNLANRQAYDPLGRINNVTVNDGLTDLVDYGYGYDNVGNRIYMQRNHELNQPADVYEYDNLYQLNHVWYGADATTSSTISSYDSTQTYDLDTLGNRLSVTADTVLTQYGPNNGTKLTNAMNRYESIESDTLGYDLRGNTLTDGNNTYSYDILNRQTSVDNGNVTTEYIYDARGRRIAKVAAGITTHFIYDTQYRVIEERDNSEALIATYTYGKGMDELLLMERGGNDYYYHRDALGSITEVSDATGTIVEQYEYDVYGEVTIYDGSDNVLTATAIDNPYLFTGRRYDAESGNYYYRARHYNPEMGRFLSEDPLGFGSGDYNLYRYVFNNPLNLLDPTGKSVKDFLVDHRDAIAVGAAAIAATAFVIATGGVGAVVILGAIAVGAGTAALTTASINVIDETCDNLWDGVARNSIYGAVAGAGAAFMGPAVLWGEGVAASATALTGLSSVGSGVGTAVTAGVIGGASAFAGGVACAIGSGADYYDCANVAAAGSALHGGSYLAGEGINFLSHVQNMREFRPKNIRFTQSTVTNESSDGVYTVEGNIERLSKEPDWHVPGKNSPTNPIRIFRKTPEMDWGEVTHPKYGFTGNTSNLENGKWYSIDNRRLYTYQQAKGRNYIPYEIIDDLKLIRRHGWKFTTGNFGKEAELIYNN
ncbi:MAG: hypothetical protein GY943_04340, partial [Chloroflexi bacterium]|nr:hypothetical protein [Chloroflexota bacterium]